MNDAATITAGLAQLLNAGGVITDPERIAVPVGAFADPTFPAPRVSVWEDRMHPWVGLPDGIEHIG